MATGPAVLFLIFCVLLALRDTLSDSVLSSQQVEPVFMLLIYCSSAVIFSLVFRALRTGSVAFAGEFFALTSKQKRTFYVLGIVTFGVYASTVFGIQFLGAATFNVIDYGSMPLLTLAVAATLGKERKEQSIENYIGVLLAVAGILTIVLFGADEMAAVEEESRQRVTEVLILGGLLAFASTVLTSISSWLQKHQIDQGIAPEVVLLYRFPIPAILMCVWWIAEGSPISTIAIIPLLLIAFFGVFLPLLLLCYGFMQTSLSQFAGYLVLVPVLTILLGPILIDGEFERLMEIPMLAGILLTLLGYCIAEQLIRVRHRKVAAGGTPIP